MVNFSSDHRAHELPTKNVPSPLPVPSSESSYPFPSSLLHTPPQDCNVLAFVKGIERYVFFYDDASRAETLRTLGRYASDPELSFTWYDAAVLSQKIRQDAASIMQEYRFNLPLSADPEEQESSTDAEDPFTFDPHDDQPDTWFFGEDDEDPGDAY